MIGIISRWWCLNLSVAYLFRLPFLITVILFLWYLIYLKNSEYTEF